tara:strand:+ start:518 stop:706 length:189 start_codon:yes stop_codon:yes gene_type:complete
MSNKEKVLFEKLKTNLNNARIEKMLHQDTFNKTENHPDEILLIGEIETLERIVEWEDFNEYR